MEAAREEEYFRKLVSDNIYFILDAAIMSCEIVAKVNSSCSSVETILQVKIVKLQGLSIFASIL